jgi:hypothetical protein
MKSNQEPTVISCESALDTVRVVVDQIFPDQHWTSIPLSVSPRDIWCGGIWDNAALSRLTSMLGNRFRVAGPSGKGIIVQEVA